MDCNSKKEGTMTDTPPKFSYYAIPRITGSCTQWKNIFRQGTSLRLQAGNFLTTDEHNQHNIFYVEKGEIQILFDTLEGQQRAVVTFGAGGIFNIAPAALQHDASGQYYCLKDSLIHCLPIDAVLSEETIQKNPSLAVSLIKHLSKLVLIYHTMLTDLQISSFFKRFCRYLLSLSVQHGSETFPLGMTQDKLAATLGVHRATLARAVQKLKQLGIVGKINSKAVEITDIRLLTELANS